MLGDEDLHERASGLLLYHREAVPSEFVAGDLSQCLPQQILDLSALHAGDVVSGSQDPLRAQ